MSDFVNRDAIWGYRLGYIQRPIHCDALNVFLQNLLIFAIEFKGCNVDQKKVIGPLWLVLMISFKICLGLGL
jgi:hypothetical protein